MELNSVGGFESSSFVLHMRRLMPQDRHPARRRKPCAPKPIPSPSLTDLEIAIRAATRLPSARCCTSSYRTVEAAARGESFAPAVLKHSKIPGFQQSCIDSYGVRVYGARFVGEHGQRFVTSCKDRFIRVYETGTYDDPSFWKHSITILALDALWTVTDFDVSPDGRWLAYASMHHLVHLVDLEHPHEPQVVLDLSVTGDGRVQHIWSVKWGHDGREIIVGTRGTVTHCLGWIVVYDVHLQKVVASIPAHDDDVNSVCFMQTGQRSLLLSGSDDAFVKMWDRRDMRGNRVGELQRPCGVFVGHQYGLTHVSTKDDGRFFLSNGKDQYIKLWDARKCTQTADVDSVKLPPRDPSFDYRMKFCPRVETQRKFQDDAVMTYAGSHETLQTLIRAHFSPMHTTGQKYIYCGSSDGRCVIYDVLTGNAVKVLHWHDKPVRDVSWHPYGCMITTGAWDGRVMLDWNVVLWMKFDDGLQLPWIRVDQPHEVVINALKISSSRLLKDAHSKSRRVHDIVSNNDALV